MHQQVCGCVTGRQSDECFAEWLESLNQGDVDGYYKDWKIEYDMGWQGVTLWHRTWTRNTETWTRRYFIEDGRYGKREELMIDRLKAMSVHLHTQRADGKSLFPFSSFVLADSPALQQILSHLERFKCD